MDILAIEGILKKLIQGLELICEAIQIGLMQYQDQLYDEYSSMTKGGDDNG